MIELILLILAGIGLTSIIVDSEFFADWKLAFQERTKKLEEKNGDSDPMVKKRKKLFYLVNCYQCSGFWVGVLLGVFLHPLDVSWYARPLEWLVCGGAVSYAAQVGMALFNYLNVSYGSES
jgi:hypothetical protein